MTPRLDFQLLGVISIRSTNARKTVVMPDSAIAHKGMEPWYNHHFEIHFICLEVSQVSWLVVGSGQVKLVTGQKKIRPFSE